MSILLNISRELVKLDLYLSISFLVLLYSFLTLFYILIFCYWCIRKVIDLYNKCLPSFLLICQFVSRCFIFVVSLGFSKQTIMSFVNRQFYFFSSNLCALFSCSIVLSRKSRKILNRSGERDSIFVLFSVLGRKLQSFSLITLQTFLRGRLDIAVLYQIEKV